MIFRLKREKKFDHKWTIKQELHHFQFSEHLLVATHLIQNELLAHGLDYHNFTAIFFPRKVHFFSKSSLANYFKFLKIIHANVCSLLLRTLTKNRDKSHSRQQQKF
jgi:hypothetical protein